MTGNRIKIEVTLDDIRRGKGASEDSCPVALAIKRALRSYEVVKVYKDEVYLAKSPQGTGVWCSLPDEVAYFSGWFYAEGTGEPFSFELIRPAPGPGPARRAGKKSRRRKR